MIRRCSHNRIPADCSQCVERKARAFLNRHLTSHQRKTLREENYIDLTGGYSGRRYRIFETGFASNIHRLRQDGRPDRIICGGPQGVPIHDFMLAQVIMLKSKSFEHEFLMRVNQSVVSAPLADELFPRRR